MDEKKDNAGWGATAKDQSKPEATATSDVKIKFILMDGGIAPAKAHADDACFDLYAKDSVVIPPGETHLFGLGFKVEVPVGYALDIRPRSGLALKGVTVANAPGTIDAGYRGEVGVILHNSSRTQCLITKKDRIAQCLITKLIPFSFEASTELGQSDRGEGGFGSTGK